MPLQTMTFRVMTLLIVLYCLRHADGELRCNVGVDISVEEEKLTNTFAEQVCPPTPGQSCLTARMELIMNGVDSLVIVSQCASACGKEAKKGCRDILRSIGASEEDEYVISNCSVQCCRSNLCNPNRASIKQDVSPTGGLRCYHGEMQSSEKLGLVMDSTLPKECPVNPQSLGKEVSCLRATVETTEKEIGKIDVGNTVMTQCQPLVVCKTITCEYILQLLPENERAKVTACEVDCCQEDLCNGASSITSQTFLASLQAILLFSCFLIIAF